MHTTRLKLSLALALAFAASATTRAQQTPTSQRSDDDYVTQKMFQNRVFDVKNRDPQTLVRVLAPLTSGFRGAIVSANPEFHTISVRDFAENIAVIEEAIRRLDTPEPVRPSVEFHVHMLVASNDEAVQNRYPAELADVVKQLQTSLGYKNFNLIGSQIVRGKDGQSTNWNKGVADLRLANDTPASKNPVYYSYNLNAVSLEGTGAQTRLRIGQFNMEMKVPLWLGGDKLVYEPVGFNNPVSLREGERVVAGTTSIADKSVVVVLSATTSK